MRYRSVCARDRLVVHNLMPWHSLTPEEKKLAWQYGLRIALAIAIPMATIVVFVLLVGGFYVRHQLNDQIRTNKASVMRVDALTRELNNERKSRESDIGVAVRQIAQASFKECVENEAQDAANAALFRKVRTLVSQGPSTPARDELLNAITDTINAREPPNEKPCVLPG